MEFRLGLILCVCCLALSPVNALGEDQYEFRGTVLQVDGRPFSGVVPVIFLQGATDSFTTRTVAGLGGKFQFKKLLPGMYVLIIAVPRWGQMQQTIEVGPSLSDSKGRIEKTFHFERRYSQASENTVSTQQLSIPQSATREYTRARDRLEKRDVPRAVEHLKKAVELAPQFAAAWNHLGTIAYHSKEYSQAEDYFREGLKQDAEFYPSLVNLGGALLSQGKAEESLSINLRAVRTRPNDALAQSQLGQSYFFLGELDNAERHLKQAKALDPKHFSFPQLVLAKIYQLRQDSASLIGELEEFLQYHPDSERVPQVTEWLKRARSEVLLIALPQLKG